MTVGTVLPVSMTYDVAEGDGQVTRMLVPGIRTD